MTIGGYESMLSKKIGILGVVMLLSTVMGACNGGKVKDTDPVSDEKNNNVVVEKVDKYQDMVAGDWLSDTKWIVSTGKLDKNIMEFDLQTKQKKPLLTVSDEDFVSIRETKLSPDKKYLFYGTSLQDLTMKKRLDLKIEPDPYNIEWVDNQNLIFTRGEKLCLVNVNGKETILVNPFKGTYPIKVGDRVYFLRDAALHMLDLKTNKTQVLIDGVEHFYLSPNKDQFAVILKRKENTQVLMLTNLEGKEQVTIATNEFLGAVHWSPNGSQLAYMTMALKENSPSVYIANTKTGKSTYVVNALTFLVPSAISWSPSGKQLLTNCITEDELSAYVQVITLKK
jgi:TolB protein